MPHSEEFFQKPQHSIQEAHPEPDPGLQQWRNRRDLESGEYARPDHVGLFQTRDVVGSAQDGARNDEGGGSE